MNDKSSLTRLRSALGTYYEEWRVLTEAEGSALEAGEWVEVEKLQETKRQLRIFIEGTRQELRGECQRCGVSARSIQQEYLPLIEQLLALENRNSQTLATRQNASFSEQQQLQQTTLTLHQIRQAYAPARPSLWESYS